MGKHGTANTLVLFATKALATATYANDAAAKTAGLDIKTGAAGTDHTFTLNYAVDVKTGATAAVGSGNIEASAAADAQLAVVAAGLYSAVSTGSKVVYANGGGTDATALTNGATYFVYKHGTANTLVLFATEALATATYANDAAAATAGLDIKTGAAGTDHTFTLNYAVDVKTGATAAVGSGNLDTSAAADAQLLVVAAGLYSAVSTGDKVAYAKGAGGTDATALTTGASYFVYKTST